MRWPCSCSPPTCLLTRLTWVSTCVNVVKPDPCFLWWAYSRTLGATINEALSRASWSVVQIQQLQDEKEDVQEELEAAQKELGAERATSATLRRQVSVADVPHQARRHMRGEPRRAVAWYWIAQDPQQSLMCMWAAFVSIRCEVSSVLACDHVNLRPLSGDVQHVAARPWVRILSASCRICTSFGDSSRPTVPTIPSSAAHCGYWNSLWLFSCCRWSSCGRS